MLLGYNTNGFAFHRLSDSVEILADLGYQAVGVTLDVHHLDPFRPNVLDEAKELRRLLDDKGMRCVVETGARFILDPRRKHRPTLVDPTPEERKERLDFLLRSLEIAEFLEADALSFWAGLPSDGADRETSMKRLIGELPALVAESRRRRIPLALEPEPDMIVATTADGMEVVQRIGDEMLGLTVDVGHAHCLSEGDLGEILLSVGDRLLNVHIEDMVAGVHDHLMFGEGEIDFGPIFDALRRARYANGVYVELSRHAHDAVHAARQSMEFLKPLAVT